eukprot:scaffold34480_cov101-Isochrysis_galbana.AAC.1
MRVRGRAEIERTRGRAASAGSRGVGVAHLEGFSDGREHRHTQAGEGGVGMNLRGGGRAPFRQRGHI